jgi:spore coat protein U-like protein
MAADAPTSDSLSIAVTATIAPKCGIGPSGAAAGSVPDLEQAQTLNFDFKLDCNSPFAIGVSSQHGALRLKSTQNLNAGTDSQGFSLEKEYQVALSVQTDAGSLEGGSCGSKALKDGTGSCSFYGVSPGSGLSSGQRTAIDRTGTITVSWPASSGSDPRRAAGEYQDTITIVVGVKS